MASFRLDLEPWIPAEWVDGTSGEVSLRDTFRHATQIRRIQGTPLEVAVLYRLLFAVFHRAFEIEEFDGWTESWHNPTQALSAAENYVEQIGADCFDLYHSERPFMQHPQLSPGKKPLAVLLFDRAQGNNPVFLDASREQDLTPVASNIVARGLLVNMAFGGSHPDKSNPLNNGKETTMYAGPLCARLVVILEGATLAETLLLNRIAGTPIGRPAWERPLPSRSTKSAAEGIADRFTRTTRFVRLLPSEDGRQSISCALHMGEQINEDGEPEDPMMPLYLASDKKMKVARLDADRAVWRSSHVLLNTDKGNPEFRPAAAMVQFGQLSDFYLDQPPIVNLRVTGFAGDAQGPTPEVWRDESLPFRISLGDDTAQFAKIKGAIDYADSAAEKLRGRLFAFAKRYLEASIPNPDSNDARRLAESLSPRLEPFWSRLAHDGERLGLTDEIAAEDWEKKVNEASARAFAQAVNALPLNGRRLRAQFDHGGPHATNKKKKGGQRKVKQ
ncbi:MAG: type I-E CRISPR-associated protein Cse1/CasA [Fimbriimonadaceae bacterium]|nr:type I-E CRISPR-associated protein Cse1/CasA [Fimbriimonadaceae bacterium]